MYRNTGNLLYLLRLTETWEKSWWIGEGPNYLTAQGKRFSMILAGKGLPEEKSLESAAERGFDRIELYMREQHLDEFDETLAAIRYGPVEVVSVHTPHVALSDRTYLKRTNELAQELDAYTVIHSQHILNIHIPQIEELGLETPYGYENNPVSVFHMENMILKQGFDLVLDTAHLYVAEEQYLDQLNYLLTQYAEQIPVIHICDSTRRTDGLGFGKGDMDMRRVSQLIDESGFEGTLVFEVMPEHQESARTKFLDYTG